MNHIGQQMKERTTSRNSVGRALLALALLALAGCGKPNPGDTTSTGAGSPVERIVPVTVEPVATEPFAERLELTGYVKAVDDVTISTEEGGVLKEWKISKGQYVGKGETLAVLNDDILRPQYEAALAQFRLADLNFEKQRKVYEEQGISELQLKTAEFGRDAAKAQADLARARFERTRVKSTVEGILDDRLINEGELAPPGARVARVVNLTRVKVLVQAPERHALTLRTGSEMSIVVTGMPGMEYKARVTFVGSTVQPDNRTVMVEAEMANPGRRLKPDMIVRVAIAEGSSRNAIVIEEGLLQQVDQSSYVVYVEENGKAVRRTVALGGRSGNRVEVLSGLQAGDRMIVSGYQDISDGQMVRVQQ